MLKSRFVDTCRVLWRTTKTDVLASEISLDATRPRGLTTYTISNYDLSIDYTNFSGSRFCVRSRDLGHRSDADGYSAA